MTTPLEKTSSSELIDFKGIKYYEYFCREVKVENSGYKSCTKTGIAFFFEEDIGILYDDNIQHATKDRVIRSVFNADNCLDYMAMNHLLISFCLVDYYKKVFTFDLTTYKLTRTPLNDYSTVVPRITKPEVVQFRGVFFIKLTQKIKDQAHRKSIGISNYYIYSPTNSTKAMETPQEQYTMHLLFGTNGLFTDNDFMVHYISNLKIYLLSSLTVSAGNLIAFQLLIDMRLAFNESLVTDVYSGKGRWNYTNTFSHNLGFTIRGSLEVKNQALRDIYIQALLFDGKDNDVDTGPNEDHSKIVFNYLVYLPNYHTYYLRFYGFFQRCLISVYKLYNPFAGLDNEHHSEKPACHLWACVFVHTFGGKSFLTLYDMRYEKIRKDNLRNFNESFDVKENITCEEVLEQNTLDLDNIPEKYFLHPLQVFNISDLQLISFNKKYRNEKDEEELQLFVFHRSSTMTTMLVNRNMKISIDNLYLSSSFLKVKIDRLYARREEYNFNIKSFKEDSYLKYWVYIVVSIILGLVYVICGHFEMSNVSRNTLEEVCKGEDRKNELLETEEREKIIAQEAATEGGVELEKGPDKQETDKEHSIEDRSSDD